jgi:hypothetical protein
MAFHKAFSSEVDTGSRQENAQMQKREPFPIQSGKALPRGECLGNRGFAASRFLAKPAFDARPPRR